MFLEYLVDIRLSGDRWFYVITLSKSDSDCAVMSHITFRIKSFNSEKKIWNTTGFFYLHIGSLYSLHCVRCL